MISHDFLQIKLKQKYTSILFNTTIIKKTMSTSKVRFPVLAYTKRMHCTTMIWRMKSIPGFSQFEETNRTVEVMEDICSLIEYNYSTIIANIRSGMVTNWGEIINNVIEKYNSIVVPLLRKA